MRLISATDKQLRSLRGTALKNAIMASEGRCIAAEVIAPAPPLLDNTANVELAAAFGADIVIMNLYDWRQPQIMGLPDADAPAAGGLADEFGFVGFGRGRTLRDVSNTAGRIVGVNLEPFTQATSTQAGRAATVESAQAVVDQGAQLLVITGNPSTGVTLEAISRSVQEISDALTDVFIVAGKMHSAGASEPLNAQAIKRLADAGADCVLFPAPGTAPGVTVDVARDWVAAAHDSGSLALSAVGTSQEGASVSVIEQLALASKMTGADVHHLGDSGYFGMTVPENLMAFSTAIRGRRHTWHRMAVRHR